MATYIAQRQQDRWVLLEGTQIVRTYPAGPAGAEEAKRAAAEANASAARRQSIGVERAMNPVRYWRRDHGLSQAALAENLGVATFTLQRWEAGDSEPPPYLFLALERLAQLL